MLITLYLLLNSTLAAVQIPYVPYVYSVYLGGCVNVTAYLDPLSGYGISAVYVIDAYGNSRRALLSPYSTPTYITGRACGAFLAVTVDKWRAVGPLIPLSYGDSAVYNLIGSLQLNISDAALIAIKSLYKPNVTGSFLYKIYEESVAGVYMAEYLAYAPQVSITGYGLVNVTPISLSSKSPDYYVYVPEPGVDLSGGYQVSVPALRFAPSQVVLLGKPSIVVKQIQIPVSGECQGYAYISDPLTRPVVVTVQLNDGETYVLQMPYFPKAINTTLLQGINATDAAGNPLSLYNLTVYPTTAGGSPVGRCLVYGVNYYVAVVLGNSTFYYPASLSGGYLTAYTDIVKPRVLVHGWGYGVVTPAVTRVGANVTVTVYLNGTAIASYVVKASPIISINDTNLAKRVRVVDVLGLPLNNFEVLEGGLTFRGSNGVVALIPITDVMVVRYRGIEYTVQLSDTIRLPVLTEDGLIRVVAASLAAGASAGLALARRNSKGRDVEVEGIAEA